MRCPFCAEEIQDAAIVCRYCGATKRAGHWQPSATAPVRAKPQRRKGAFTMRSTGVLLIASAFFELSSVTDAVPLLGAVRDGAAAFVYHGVFAAAFMVMGIGLWRAAPWGYRAVLAGLGLYSIDRIRYILDGEARTAELHQQAKGYGEIFQIVDTQTLNMVVNWVTLGVVLSCAGFALYVYFRRDYFQPPAATP